jgi:hypothetical protein
MGSGSGPRRQCPHRRLRGCQHQAFADLEALVESGRGDVPLSHLKFRCSSCGSCGSCGSDRADVARQPAAVVSGAVSRQYAQHRYANGCGGLLCIQALLVLHIGPCCCGSASPVWMMRPARSSVMKGAHSIDHRTPCCVRLCTLIQLSPWRWLSDAIELRRLRRRLPRAHRAWSRASGEQRPENNAEYLARLRVLACEREQLRAQKGNTTRMPTQGERGPA